MSRDTAQGHPGVVPPSPTFYGSLAALGLAVLGVSPPAASLLPGELAWLGVARPDVVWFPIVLLALAWLDHVRRSYERAKGGTTT